MVDGVLVWVIVDIILNITVLGVFFEASIFYRIGYYLVIICYSCLVKKVND